MPISRGWCCPGPLHCIVCQAGSMGIDNGIRGMLLVFGSAVIAVLAAPTCCIICVYWGCSTVKPLPHQHLRSHALHHYGRKVMTPEAPTRQRLACAFTPTPPVPDNCALHHYGRRVAATGTGRIVALARRLLIVVVTVVHQMWLA